MQLTDLAWEILSVRAVLLQQFLFPNLMVCLLFRLCQTHSSAWILMLLLIRLTNSSHIRMEPVNSNVKIKTAGHMAGLIYFLWTFRGSQLQIFLQSFIFFTLLLLPDSM